MSNRILKADRRSLENLISLDEAIEILKKRAKDQVSKLADEYVSNQEKAPQEEVSPKSGKWTRQRFDKAARKGELVLAILRHAIQVKDLGLFVGDPRSNHALAMKRSALGPVQYFYNLHTPPIDDTIFTVRNEMILPKSVEDDLKNKPYYFDRSEIQKLFGVDLWGPTNRRLARRKARSNRPDAPGDKSQSPGGRPPKYDWPKFEVAVFAVLQEKGIPSRDSGRKGWRYQANLVRYMMDPCHYDWEGDGDGPGETIIKEHVKAAIEKFRNTQTGDN